MKKDRPPLAERLKQGLQEGIAAARGERDDLVETWIDLDAADEGIRKSVHIVGEKKSSKASTSNR